MTDYENYLNDVNKEYKRLKKVNFSEFSNIINDDYFSFNKKKIVPYFRVLELIRELSKTHFVFNHGSSTQSTIMTLITTALMRKENQAYSNNHYSFRLQSALNENNPLQKVRIEIFSNKKIDDHKYSRELLSTSICQSDIRAGESYLSYFKKNMTGCGGDKEISIIEKFKLSLIALPFYVGKEERDLSEKIDKFIKDYEDLSAIFSVILDKEDFSLCGYTSKAFGKSIDCPEPPIKKKYSIEDLSKYQFGCPFNSLGAQARLHTSHIEEMQLPVCCFSTLDDDKFKQLTQKIENFVEDFFDFGQNEVNNNNNLVAI
ncbi:MAG: hypothetical protein WDZ28_06110 [Simkaniaceae bacterium]